MICPMMFDSAEGYTVFSSLSTALLRVSGKDPRFIWRNNFMSPFSGIMVRIGIIHDLFYLGSIEDDLHLRKFLVVQGLNA